MLRDAMDPEVKVLIAEDHPDSREALRALLEALGYDVIVAANGREAVDQAVSGRPDLILMDVMMPVMDGLEATRCLRRAAGFENVPIIAVTAMEGAGEQVMDAGCDDYVRKPIDIRRFVAHLPEWLHGNSPYVA
jgi:CheY-like chemotaxis protein